MLITSLSWKSRQTNTLAYFAEVSNDEGKNCNPECLQQVALGSGDEVGKVKVKVGPMEAAVNLKPSLDTSARGQCYKTFLSVIYEFS